MSFTEKNKNTQDLVLLGEESRTSWGLGEAETSAGLSTVGAVAIIRRRAAPGVMRSRMGTVQRLYYLVRTRRADEPASTVGIESWNRSLAVRRLTVWCGDGREHGNGGCGGCGFVVMNIRDVWGEPMPRRAVCDEWGISPGPIGGIVAGSREAPWRCGCGEVLCRARG